MININQPILGEEERKEVDSIIKSGYLTSGVREGGPKVREFEGSLAKYLRAKHVVAVNSGTSALYASLMASGIGHEDEVLVPSFTFLATANAVLMTGAKPVFVDIRKDYNMDPNDLKKRISKTSRAVIPVHLYGYPAKIDEINEVAEKHDLAVIEDACQSLGATFHGKQTGTLGTAGCFSFYPSKIITCGEGGAIATNDDEVYDRLLMVRNHGMVKGYDSKVMGANLRMPEIEAAIAKTQLSKLDGFLEARRRNAKALAELLENGQGYELPEEEDGLLSNWYLYTVAVSKSRDAVIDALHERGVGAAVYYKTPINKTPLYSKLGYANVALPNTYWAAEHSLCLPVHPRVSKEDIAIIAKSFKEVVKA
ncbi:MAG: DegT/DnrJ/EryC1/StrS family aminotransferase [Thaumarchaeota archaeon]|nr:DegT/DnrJ/EryC1/StrS family aminotransferase [Nitrososphaerota archaeon]